MVPTKTPCPVGDIVKLIEVGGEMPKLSAEARERWFRRIFRAQAARNGGIIRRSVNNVKELASEAEFIAYVKAKGFHMVRSGDQYVVLCHQGDFKLIC